VPSGPCQMKLLWGYRDVFDQVILVVKKLDSPPREKIWAQKLFSGKVREEDLTY